MRRIEIVLLGGLLSLGCGDDGGDMDSDGGTGGSADAAMDGSMDGGLVAFTAEEVQSVFTASCALPGCHVAMNPPQGMSLVNFETNGLVIGVGAMEASLNRIKPGSKEDSYLWHKISDTHLDESVGGSGVRMPAGRADPLEQDTIDRIGLYIEGLTP